MSEQLHYQDDDQEQQQYQQGEQQQQFQNDHDQVGLQLDGDQEQQQQDEFTGVSSFTPIEQLLQQGFNEKDLEKLRTAGIFTIESSLHFADRALIQGGFPENKLQKLRAIAQNRDETAFVSAQTLLAARSNMAIITTRSSQVDNLLGGGLEPGSITEIYGEFNTGKTQFCHTLSVSSQLPREMGGALGRVLYIDTEGTFRPERIAQIASGLGLNTDQVLANIQVARATNSDHQRDLLRQSAKLMSVDRYSLIIVDSVTSLFRTDYVGRGSLADRQAALGKFLRELHALATTYNVVAVITNQVVSDIAGAAQMGGGDNKKPIGGNILAHASTTRLQFRKGKGGVKVCKVVDSPLIAEGEAPFRISDMGIVDEDHAEF